MEDELIIYLDVNAEDMYSGMEAISFVKKPATQLKWNKFSDDDNVKHNFKSNESRRVVTGPIMLCETPIKRSSKSLGTYYVKFSEDTIFTMMKKYFKENKIHKVNENHKSNKVVPNVYLIESFIISDRVTSELYPDLPMGTWMGSFYIEDEDYWNDVIMTDEFEGFSLEGNFIENYEMSMVENTLEQVKNTLFSDQDEEVILNKISKLLKIEM